MPTMDDNTNVVPEMVMNQQQSRTPVVAAGVGAVVVVAGAALLAVRPWQHDAKAAPAAMPANHSAAAPATRGPVLHHAAVEKFLVDLEDATSPVCNGGADIPAKLGKTFSCVDANEHWKIRITEVAPDGGVRYELID